MSRPLHRLTVEAFGLTRDHAIQHALCILGSMVVSQRNEHSNGSSTGNAEGKIDVVGGSPQPTCKPDLQVEKEDVCVWREHNDGWQSGCTRSPSYSRNKFCQYCGKPVQIGGGE